MQVKLSKNDDSVVFTCVLKVQSYIFMYFLTDETDINTLHF